MRMKKSSRNNQRQIWADEMFLKKLEEIRAKRTLAGKPPLGNLGDLTKMIAESENFQKLEEEIINYDPMKCKKHKKMKINIRFDGGLG